MYRLYFFLVLFAMAVFSSCSSSGKEGMKDILSFPVYPIESSVQYNQEELITRGPWEFHRIGDNFFVFYGVPSSAAQVFRMSDCGLLGEFVPIGMGPTECSVPRYAGCSAGEDTVYIYDTGKKKMFEFEVPVSQTDTLKYKFVGENRASDSDLHRVTSRLKNGLSVSLRYSGTRHLFTLYNEQMDSLCTFGSLPLPVSDDELKDFKHFQGIMVSEGNTVYFGCKFLPYLCAYEVNGKDDIQMKFEHSYFPTSYTYTDRISIDRKKCMNTFRDIKLAGGYIWTTFMGNTVQSQLDDPKNEEDAKYLLAFDAKNGLPVGKFRLPHKGNHFCFSKDNKDLFLFTADLNIDVMKVEELLDVIE